MGTDGFGPLADNTPANDGTDTDGDGQCDVGDTDDDNDGVLDGADLNSLDPNICGDSDGDGCDDCAVGTDGFGPLADNTPANDGTDTDGDGQCDSGDTDDDNDGVLDGADLNSLDPSICGDSDGDGCDDCSVGTDGFGPLADNTPNNDGTDTDGDGICDLTDPDIDGDGILNECDVDQTPGADCNGNGKLDSCETCDTDVFVSTTVPVDGVDNFADVASAYAAVCAGGTVHVAAGTYSAELILSDANAKDGITIDGVGATTILDGGVKTTNSVAVAGMTFSNMTIRHTDGTAGEGLFRMDNSGSISDLTFDGVVFDGQGIAGVHGILGQSLIGTVTVTGCTLENIANWAVFDSDSGGGLPAGGISGLTGFVFTNNTVRDNDGAIALRGAHLGAAIPTTSVVVTGNSFTNMNTNLYAGPCSYPDNQCGWAGIEVTRVSGTVTVTGNTFDNLQLGSFGEGEGLQAWMITDLIVTGNSFNNCDSGIEIANQDTNPVNASINDNSFSNMAARAIGVWDAGSFLSGASSTAGIDASCNYWGNDNGPLVAGQNDHTANGETYGDELIGTMTYALWRTGSVA
ncbi:MAG: right-handed parallel beta-helix repeat-containing protein, partial [Acidimicrobiales bacterium]